MMIRWLTMVAFVLASVFLLSCGRQTEEEIPLAAPTEEEAPTQEREIPDIDLPEIPDDLPDEEDVRDPVPPVNDDHGDDTEGVDAPEGEAGRHVGTWRGLQGAASNTLFIFYDDDTMEMGVEAMMFRGDYTVEHHDGEMYLEFAIELMGQRQESRFTVTFPSPDQMRLTSVADTDPRTGDRRFILLQRESH